MSNVKYEDADYKCACSEKTLVSETQGFFKTFLDNVMRSLDTYWINLNFGKLTTDRQRLEFVHTSKKITQHLNPFLSNVQSVFRPKNGKVAQEKRLEGERLMARNTDDQKALRILSQSVLKADKKEGGLALAFWSRAELLMKMQKYCTALNDLQQAQKEGLPDSFKTKLFIKMGICYAALKLQNKAIISFNLADKLITQEANGQHRKELHSMLKSERRKLDKLKEDNDLSGTPEDKTSLSRISGQPHSEIPNAISKLSISTSKSMGKYLTANQSISTGEVLVVEPPYASCLLPDFFGTHCYHCFKRLEAPYGCTDCASIAFCSTECRDEALSTYHRYECKYLDLLIGSGMSVLSHTALRMVTQNGLSKCLAIFQNRNNEKVFQLCANADLRDPRDFLQRTLMAAFLLKCLQKSSFFEGSKSNAVSLSETEYQIGEMLLFNLQMLQFNAHEVCETLKYTNDVGNVKTKNVCIGIGIYLTASLFNHDCHPALSRSFIGKDIVLTSTRPLKPNDIVPENYGPIFTNKRLSERKKWLNSRYWFDCQCAACKEDWPSVADGLRNASLRLKCPTFECSQVITVPSNGSLTSIEKTCSQCQKCVDFTDRIETLKWCRNTIESIKNQSLNTDRVALICETIDKFYRVSLPPNEEAQSVEEILRSYFSTLECSRLT